TTFPATFPNPPLSGRATPPAHPQSVCRLPPSRHPHEPAAALLGGLTPLKEPHAPLPFPAFCFSHLTRARRRGPSVGGPPPRMSVAAADRRKGHLKRYPTVSLATIPAALWPGTVQ